MNNNNWCYFSESITSENYADKQFFKNVDNTKPLVFVFDSKGGEVPAAQQFKADLQEFRKQNPQTPVYSFINGNCASAAYWMACFSDKIFAEKTKAHLINIGSIGVRLDRLDLTDYNEKQGIKFESFVSHPNKELYNPNTSLTDEQKALLAEKVNETSNEFFADVSKNRNIPIQTIQNLNAGVFNAIEAKEKGLIDDVISFENFTQNAINQQININTANIERENVLTQTATMDKDKEIQELKATIAALKEELEGYKKDKKIKEDKTMKALNEELETLKASLSKQENLISEITEQKKLEAKAALQAFTGQTVQENPKVYAVIDNTNDLTELETIKAKYETLLNTENTVKAETFTGEPKQTATNNIDKEVAAKLRAENNKFQPIDAQALLAALQQGGIK